MKMKNKTILFLSFCCSVSLLSGCVSSFNCNTDQVEKIQSSPYDAVVAVKKFADERPISLDDSDNIWVAAVPLVPFGWGDFMRPEKGSYFLGTSSFEFNPVVDITKATEEGLVRSGLFKHVYYADQGTDYKNAKYVFTGIIYSTNYHEKLLTYGLSIGSPVVWLIGLPDGKTTNEIKIKFILKDPKTDKIIWSYCADEDESTIQWCYIWTRNFKDYSVLVNKSLNEAFNNLSQFLSSTEYNSNNL